jgi:branched-chain amino acid transport system ATP-binding protein
MLEIRDLECRYGSVAALKGVSLSVEKGQIVALIGANGAGKSTLLRSLSGLLAPARGSIMFDGEDIARCSPPQVLKRGIAHCPEGRHVFPDMSVEENLDMGAYLRRDVGEIAADRARIFDEFPRLAERRRQIAGTLSGGEQQMLAIGRALMSEPKLLLLDEPSLGLSPRMAEEVLSVIVELRSQGITILLVEQNVHNALSVADRAYVFETGRIVAHDTSAALLGNPDLLRAYLGA